MDHVKDKVY